MGVGVVPGSGLWGLGFAGRFGLKVDWGCRKCAHGVQARCTRGMCREYGLFRQRLKMEGNAEIVVKYTGPLSWVYGHNCFAVDARDAEVYRCVGSCTMSGGADGTYTSG